MSAPKVTLDEVEAAIKEETYTVLPDGRTTVCQLTLDNNFTVEGLSACVSIENFDAETGNEISRGRALNKVWEHLGFRLADKIKRDAAIKDVLEAPYGRSPEQHWFDEWEQIIPEDARKAFPRAGS